MVGRIGGYFFQIVLLHFLSNKFLETDCGFYNQRSVRIMMSLCAIKSQSARSQKSWEQKIKSNYKARRIKKEQSLQKDIMKSLVQEATNFLCKIYLNGQTLTSCVRLTDFSKKY